VVVGVERLEDSVQVLEEEGPEIVKWAKVLCAISDMCHIMVVWLDNTESIKLIPLLVQ
jgi:hypothetical protein